MENDNPIYPGSSDEKSEGHVLSFTNEACKMILFYDMGAMIT
jgi:hypothetical protein